MTRLPCVGRTKVLENDLSNHAFIVNANIFYAGWDSTITTSLPRLSGKDES